MKNVAASESIGILQVLGRDDLHAFDEAGKIRRIRGERFDYRVAEFPAARVPVPFSQFVRRKLNVGGEDVLAVGCERRVKNCGNRSVEIGRFRKFAVLGSIESAFEIINFRSDVDAPGEGSEIAF